MTTFKKISKNIGQTQKLAQDLAEKLLPLSKPVLIFLDGDLGAGKTTFVRAFASFWNLDSEVSSPTFTLMNQYENESVRIAHFDLYRLGTPEEAEELGIDDFISLSDFSFVEWPDKADLSEPDLEIQISLGHSETERIFYFKFNRQTEVSI